MENFSKHGLGSDLQTAIERKKDEAIRCVENIIKRIEAKDE